ncbi:MAG: class I SAM-dependent methyltransferase [Streptosporangiaceae bacterium]|jgi:SAM-dependent methyltransferase
MKATARTARTAGGLAVQLATSGAQQNFLGASWVARLVDAVPGQARERAALRLLSLSPHYFYDRDIRAEAERNRRSRRALAEALVAPHLNSRARVIDYGCGPGYMARAVAGIAAHVDAVDISRGVLACARALNGDPGVSYLTPEELGRREGQADLAYSFAVVQHMRTEAVIRALCLLAAKLRSEGTLLVHFAEPGPGGWRTEAEWDAGRSLAGRLRRRYGLNCFGRTSAEMRDLAARHGFVGITVTPLGGQLSVPGDDDITSQHMLTARRA